MTNPFYQKTSLVSNTPNTYKFQSYHRTNSNMLYQIHTHIRQPIYQDGTKVLHIRRGPTILLPHGGMAPPTERPDDGPWDPAEAPGELPRPERGGRLQQPGLPHRDRGHGGRDDPAHHHLYPAVLLRGAQAHAPGSTPTAAGHSPPPGGTTDPIST